MNTAKKTESENQEQIQACRRRLENARQLFSTAQDLMVTTNRALRTHRDEYIVSDEQIKLQRIKIGKLLDNLSSIASRGTQGQCDALNLTRSNLGIENTILQKQIAASDAQKKYEQAYTEEHASEAQFRKTQQELASLETTAVALREQVEIWTQLQITAIDDAANLANSWSTATVQLNEQSSQLQNREKDIL